MAKNRKKALKPGLLGRKLPVNKALLAVIAVAVVVVGFAILRYSHASSTVLWGSSFGGNSDAAINSTVAEFPNSQVGRYYYSGDPVTYSAGNLSTIPANQAIMVSFKSDQTKVSSGAYDATFTTILKSWNASGRTIYWTWWHEADDPNKTSLINPTTFTTGWNRLLAIERANPSPRVKSMSIFMATLLVSGQPHGNPESWYVNSDVLGFDCYNLNNVSLIENYATSKGKSVAFPEIGATVNGSTATDAQAKTWLQSFASKMTPNVFAVVWWNQNNNTLSNLPNTLIYLKSLASSVPPTSPPPTSPPPTSPPPTSPPPTSPPPTSPPPTSPPATSPPPPVDTEKPSAPGNFQPSLVTANNISLSWSASTDNVGVVGYRIYRDGQRVSEQTNLDYLDNSVAASTTYSYAVEAYDAASNVSDQSTISVRSQDPPSNGGGGGGGQITITPQGSGTQVQIDPGASPQVGGTICLGTDAAGKSTVAVDGSTVSTNCQLDTSYLTNGNHTVTVTQDGITSSRMLEVNNKLAWWQNLRNNLFAGLHGNKTLINLVIGIIILLLVLIAAYFAARYGRKYLPGQHVQTNLR